MNSTNPKVSLTPDELYATIHTIRQAVWKMQMEEDEALLPIYMSILAKLIMEQERIEGHR